MKSLLSFIFLLGLLPSGGLAGEMIQVPREQGEVFRTEFFPGFHHSPIFGTRFNLGLMILAEDRTRFDEAKLKEEGGYYPWFKEQKIVSTLRLEEVEPSGDSIRAVARFEVPGFNHPFLASGKNSWEFLLRLRVSQCDGQPLPEALNYRDDLATAVDKFYRLENQNYFRCEFAVEERIFGDELASHFEGWWSSKGELYDINKERPENDGGAPKKIGPVVTYSLNRDGDILFKSISGDHSSYHYGYGGSHTTGSATLSLLYRRDSSEVNPRQ